MGMRTTESDELVGRIVGVEIIVTLVVLGGIGLLALRAVRHGLRPLEEIQATADAVADARAVEPDRPLTLEAAGPVPVRGDAARLWQVLANLLANVRRHTPPGAPAEVRVRADGGRAVVEVADTGPGLAAEERARVFERFYRTEASRSRDHGGAGLGLSIVAAVAEAHRGWAVAVPAPGGGEVFQVSLPLRPSGETEAGRASREGDGTSAVL